MRKHKQCITKKITAVKVAKAARSRKSLREKHAVKSRHQPLSALVALLKKKSIHAVAPVWAQPSIAMTHWSLYQIMSGNARRTRHLVGWANDEGRVSSEIVKINLHTRTVSTYSGRIYELLGEPGRDADAQYVFDLWCRSVRASAIRDVTRALWRLVREKPATAN